MPARVKQSRPFDAQTSGAFFQFLQLLQGATQVFFITKDANQILHGFLQIAMNRIWTLTIAALKESQHRARGVLDLPRVDGHGWYLVRVFGGSQSCTAAEDKQVRERVAAQPVCSMQPCR